MANPRLDWLEQQLSNLITMCEVLMKKMEKNNETMKANNAKLYALVAKFDNCSDDNNDELHCYEQSQMVLEDINNLVNPQDPICHVEVSLPCAIILIQAQPHHYSKIAPSPPTIESQHKAIYKSATHCPTTHHSPRKFINPTCYKSSTS
jgi:hypothetical protein